MKKNLEENVKQENTYKAPIGKKFKKVIKVLGALGLAATMALGATVFTSCKNLGPSTPVDPNPPTPPSPVEPVDPKPEDKDKILLEKSAGEYNNIVENIKNANSLTTSIKTVNGGDGIIFEIQNNKLKLTDNKDISYVESVEGQTFQYTMQENEWHKNLATNTHTAQTIKTTLNETLEGVEWTSAKQENNAITLNGTAKFDIAKENVSCQYNVNNSSLVIKSQYQTLSVYNVDNTLVNIPTQFVDDTQEKPPVEEDFKITADNIEAVKQAMRPHIENICYETAQKSTLKDVYSTYLTKSENSSVVDTIGAVYTMEFYGDTNLVWAEITIPTQEDITYEQIYKEELNYNRMSITYNEKFSFAAANEEKEQELMQILKPQTLGKDYEKADWTGWYGLSRLGQDPHTIVMLKDNAIFEYNLKINRSNSTLTKLQVAKENFLGKEPSKDTYSQVLKTYKVYEGNKQFLAVETPEKEQNI